MRQITSAPPSLTYLAMLLIHGRTSYRDLGKQAFLCGAFRTICLFQIYCIRSNCVTPRWVKRLVSSSMILWRWPKYALKKDDGAIAMSAFICILEGALLIYIFLFLKFTRQASTQRQNTDLPSHAMPLKIKCHCITHPFVSAPALKICMITFCAAAFLSACLISCQ